jgi:hypothetical protein
MLSLWRAEIVLGFTPNSIALKLESSPDEVQRRL